MLKPAAHLCLSAVLGVGLIAWAQDPPVVVCENGDIDRCYAVDMPSDQGSEGAESGPGAPTWSLDGAGEILPAPPELDFLERAPLEPIQAWLEWGPGRVEEDPLYLRADGCAYTPARARGRFARAAQEQDLNALLTVYQWRGKTDAQATPVIDLLSLIGGGGRWERSSVGMWTGPTNVRAKALIHWRWAEEERTTYLAMKKVDECWLVELSSNPGEMVEIPVEELEIIETVLSDDEWVPRVDTDDPNVLIF